MLDVSYNLFSLLRFSISLEVHSLDLNFILT
jgi:hypothetical protein